MARTLGGRTCETELPAGPVLRQSRAIYLYSVIYGHLLLPIQLITDRDIASGGFACSQLKDIHRW